MDSSIHQNFLQLNDPRLDRTQKHPLINILFIAICAVICGSDSWVSIEHFGNIKRKFLSQYLDLSNGIPSHDTFNRVFSIIDIKAFGECFISWMEHLAPHKKDVISIDGKAMRATKSIVNNKGPLYLVNAWCSENQLVLGQVKVDDKSNEITAIPELLKILDVQDATITMDAMGCQKKIVTDIRERDAHYVLALKGNQKGLHDDISLFLQSVEPRKSSEKISYKKTIDSGHGRIEIREYWTTDDLDWLESKKDWTDLTTATMMKSTRIVNGNTSEEYGFYISDHPLKYSNKISSAIRTHWQVENCLHWSLDVSFNEDQWRSKLGVCAESMGFINKIVLNLLRKEVTVKASIKNKRFRAALDEQYLSRVVGVSAF